jgi:hypothetical protein
LSRNSSLWVLFREITEVSEFPSLKDAVFPQKAGWEVWTARGESLLIIDMGARLRWFVGSQQANYDILTTTLVSTATTPDP